MERLTRASGLWSDGEPQIVLARHDGPYAEILQEALRKLAKYEDEEERRAQHDG